MRYFLTLIFLTTGLLMAQSYDVSIAKRSNYNSWGAAWDSVYVMSNNLTTVAIVPGIGGRIMQYDLGPHAFMYLNDAMKGTTSNTGGQMWGGMRQLASPQSDLSGTSNWPPPPALDSKAYTATITRSSGDSSSVLLESQVETGGGTNFNGLQFRRTVTLYKNSSHVRVKMTMVNANNAAQRSHGIWDITEVTGANPGVSYDTMIWVYVPLNPSSTMGAGRGYAQLQKTDTTQWVKNAAPGVLGVKYRHVEAKMGADSRAGWICTVDRRNGYAYAKRYSYVNGANYPDSGSSVEVYTYGNTYSCLEVEVMGPMKTLASGDSTSLIEDWYAGRSAGPVYSVNDAGLVTKPFVAQQAGDSVKAQGTYGVFYPGTVKSIFTNASGTVVAVADSFTVTPLDSFVFAATLKVPAGAARLVLAAYKLDGTLAGNLDSIAITPTAVRSSSLHTGAPFECSIASINRKGAYLFITINSDKRYSVEVCQISGKRIARFTGSRPQTFSCRLAETRSGVYIVKAQAADRIAVQKVVVSDTR